MKSLGSTDLKRLHRDWRRKTTGSVSLLLENVQGPYNVGAIVRTAAAYRVDRVWLVGTTPDLNSSKVAKTALGCDRYLTATRSESVEDAVAAIKATGASLSGVELADDAVPAHELTFGGSVCLALGNEDHGLSPTLLGLCDHVVYLPLLGKVGSLNVGTAAALAIYEARRQSWTGTGAAEDTDR